MDKLKMSPAELLKEVKIMPIEEVELNRVFDLLIKQDPKKPKEHMNKISAGDLHKVLNFLGCKPSKAEVALYIWEVDDDLD